MAAVKRHWKFLVPCMIALISGALLIFGDRFDHPRAVGQTNEGASANSAEEFQILRHDFFVARERLCLLSEDMAVMGCSQDQAEKILEFLLTWCRDNHSQLSQLLLRNVRAEQALRELEREISVGSRFEVPAPDRPQSDSPPDAVEFVQIVNGDQVLLADVQTDVVFGPPDPSVVARIPGLQGEVEAAAQEVARVFEAVRGPISAYLTFEQNRRWRDIVLNHGLPSRYRYVFGLSPDDVKTLRIANLRYGSGTPKVVEVEQAIIIGSKRLASDSATTNLAQFLPEISRVEQKLFE